MTTVLTDADLTVDHRAFRFQPHRQCDQQHHRPGHRQQRAGRDQIEEALGQATRRGIVETARKHQPRRVHDIELDHAGFALEEGRQVGDQHALLHAIEHLFHRHGAAALVGRDHDFIDIQANGDRAQTFVGADQMRLIDHDRLRARRYEPEDLERLAVTLTPQPRIDEIGVAAGAIDQHPLFQRLRRGQPRYRVANAKHAASTDGQRQRQYASTDVGAGQHVIDHQQGDAAEREREADPQQQIQAAVTNVGLIQPERQHGAGQAERDQQRAQCDALDEILETDGIRMETQARRRHDRHDQYAQLGEPQTTDR